MNERNKPTPKQITARIGLIVTAFTTGMLSSCGKDNNIPNGTLVEGSGATTLYEGMTEPGADIRKTFIVPEGGKMTIENNGHAGRRIIYRVRSIECVPINPEYKEESEYYENEAGQVPCTGQVFKRDITPVNQ